MDACRDFDELKRQVDAAVGEQHHDVVAALLTANARRMLFAGWEPHRKADLAKLLKARDQFRYARRLYGELAADKSFSAQERETFRQQYALCVYKDLELPSSRRYDRALEILEELGPEDRWTAESLGLAGAVHKRRWQAEAKLTALETAYSYYSRGFERAGDPERAYCGINAAFVLDCLAFADRSGEEDTRRRREQARAIREQLVVGFETGELELDVWGAAMLVEAQFGLGRYGRAKRAVDQYLAMGPDGWQRESTASQVAELARLLEVSLQPGGDAAAAIQALVQRPGPMERRARLGKVGLALSGGGFRASLFHIGVLARLAERDALRGIEVLSCVSGGSIVGAFYYLRVRELLQRESDEAIEAAAYDTLVQGVAEDVLRAVQRNPRVQLSGNAIDNWKMAVRRGYSRTDRIAELFDTMLYATDQAKGEPARWRMDDLLITPKDTPSGFSPRYGNWEREAKVPILVLNATALNTGHSWQFTASWMGEPPDILDEQIDANPRLRRTYYGELPPPYRDEPPLLATAVAASACVPGLFPPIQLKGLFDGLKVELVDGGVHDNQGVASLIEQECSTILVSDASGQMDELKAPGRTLLSVAMRSQSVLSSRVRGAQLADLVARERAGLLRRLMIIHLKKGLASEQRNPGTEAHPAPEPWSPAQDEIGDELGAGLREYGIDETMQRALAAIRTDLDSFSDDEAYALMAAGYKMACHELDPALEDYPAPIQADWPFDAMRARLERSLASDPELSVELPVAKERFGKPFRRFWRRRTSGNGSFGRVVRGSARAGAIGAYAVALPVWATVAVPLSAIGAGGTRLYLATIGKVRRNASRPS
jgi:predicted acylesterase/phospholipase RssA